MCMSPKTPDMPQERQEARSPDAGVARSAATSTDRSRRGRAGTILTSPQGVTDAAMVGQKTLLGL